MKKLNFAMQWHITERCQNKCKHCYMYDAEYKRRLQNEKGIKEFIEILDNIERFEEKYQVNIDSFYITGGDPLAHPDCYKLFEELNKRKRNIHILGIPERVTLEEIALLKNKKILSYQLSIDGTKEIHDSIRGEGSFQKTINALRLLNKYGIESKVMFTLNRKNYNELFKVIKYLDENRIHTIFSFDFLIFQGNGEKLKELLSLDEVKGVFTKYREAEKELFKKESTVKLVEKSPLFNVFGMETAFNEKKYIDYSVCAGCYCGYSSLAILPNADVYPCRRLPVKVGNLLEDELEDILLGNELMQKFRHSECYEECGTCVNFKICRGCPALAYSLTGSPFSKMPYCFCKEERNRNVETRIETNYDREMSLIQKTFYNEMANCEEKNLFNMVKLLNEKVYVYSQQ